MAELVKVRRSILVIGPLLAAPAQPFKRPCITIMPAHVSSLRPLRRASLLGLPATTSMPSMGVPRSCRSVAKSKRSTLHESFRALRAIRGYPQSWMRQTLGCQGSACEENPIFRTYAADMQNLMPADRSMNSARGDRAFADLLPQDDWRGQVGGRPARGRKTS